MLFKLDDEYVDQIVAAELRETYELLKEAQPNPGMYSWDDEEYNARKVKQLMKAIKRVHNYYSVPSEHIVE